MYRIDRTAELHQEFSRRVQLPAMQELLTDEISTRFVANSDILGEIAFSHRRSRSAPATSGHASPRGSSLAACNAGAFRRRRGPRRQRLSE